MPKPFGMTSPDNTALNERRRQLTEKLSAAGIHMSHGSPLDEEIDKVEEALENTAAMDVETRRSVMEPLLIHLFEADYRRRFGAVNDVLLPLGRCISPAYMTNAVFNDLRRRCDQITAAIAAGADPSADVDRIIDEISRVYFAPHIRAFMVVRAQRLPHLNLVSHYLEDAAMAFYRRNYFACANALTTAVERLLLEHIGWKFGMKDMRHPDIRAAVAALTPSSGSFQMDFRFETYKPYVVQFLEEYQKPSRLANLSASRFNRAFIQHVNDDASYYTHDDCVTAFQFFDLYVEFVSAQVGKEMYVFVPEDDEAMNVRTRHYWRMIIQDWLHGPSPSAERALLELNPHFRKEAEDSNFLSLYTAGVEQNRMIGSALMTLGVRNFAEVLPLVSDPVDPIRFGLFANLAASYCAIMGLPEENTGVPATPEA